MKKVTFTSLCLMLLGLFISSGIYSQTNVNMPFNNGPLTFTIAPPGTCFFNFYDNNGPGANYSNNSGVNSIATFLPANSATHRIRVTFSTLSAEVGWDALFIHNGPSVASPLIPGTANTVNFGGGGWNSNPGVQTSTDATGALTFRFRSDASVTAAGWIATVAQVPITGCTLTAPAGVTVSTGATTCAADVVSAAPTFSPGGCQTAYTVQYNIDGGPYVTVPQPLAGTVTLSQVPKGVHTINWRIVDPCGNAVISQANQTVTVVDLTPPVLTCPLDIVQTLLPGECSAIIGWNLSLTDNCPLLVPILYTQNPPSLNPNQPMAQFASLNCGFTQTKFGRVFGGPTQPAFDMTGLQVGISNDQGTGGPGAYTYNVYRLTSGTAPAAGNANMQLLFGPHNVNMPNVVQQYVPVNFPGPVAIPAGSYFFVEIIDQDGNFTMGNIAFPDLPGTPSYIAANACGLPNFMTFASLGFSNLSLAFNVVGLIAAPPPIQTSGLPSGSVFPIGTTTNCFQAQDVAGNTATCCFDVVINEYPNATTTLACNDNVQVSVNENCVAFVTTDMILEGGPYGCYDDYIVTVEGFGSGNGGVLIDNDAIGETLLVTVTDPETGNSCWGTISVEDKIPPTITCRDQVIMCGNQLPSEPAPGLSGYQTLLITGLSDDLDLNTLTYNFDYNYLPSTPVLDANVRVRMTGHTWLPEINFEVVSPAGQAVSFLTIGGCIGQEFVTDAWWDDEGGVIFFCVDLEQGANGMRLQGMVQGVSNATLLGAFDGTDANGIWQVRLTDVGGFGAGVIEEVGLELLIDAPQILPADNCGEIDLTYTDTESGDPCEGLVVTRHWVVTDGSGNTAACDQDITVTPLVLDSVDCPAAYVGHCGDPTTPDYTGWPTVNGNPITDEDNVCNIFVGYWDKPLNDCGNGEKIIRTWTILDWCTQTTLECVQVLKFTDDEAPELDCPSDFEVGTDFWYCYANVSVPKPDVYDECGSAYTLTLTSSAGDVHNFGNNYVINGLPLGDHTVTWHAEDECGNHSSCSFTITVVDDVVPVALCDEHTIVSLTNDGPYGVTLVPATVFDDGSYDNCGPVTFRVRRMDSCIEFDWTTEGACEDDIPGGIPPVNSRDRGTVHRDCVPFACCDVGAGPIMVELEVTDASGNRNFCMVEAIVQDKISPFIACPPDIIVSCDFWFNVQEGTFEDEEGNNNGNLDEDPLSPIFGNMYDAFAYDDDESVRGDIIINDPGNENYNQPHFWGIEGWADDNCEVNLQVRVRVFDDCSGDDLPGNPPAGAVKLVERRFSASDGNDGVAPGTCTQRIWVVDYEPFYINDRTCFNSDNNDGVIWPCDVLLTDCPEDLGDTGEPTIFDDACSLIGVTYEDTRFDFVDGACFKILREWAVIDWCQYGSDGEGGYNGLWYYTQVIKVHDEEGPEYVDCPVGPVVLCVADDGVSLPNNNQAFLGEDDPNASSCSVHLNLSRVVHETCSDYVNYDVKIFPFNGTEFIYLKTTTTATVDENNDAVLTFDTRQNPIQAVRLNGLPYNSQWCGDYHRILWSSEDGCGNWSHCEYLIRLEDCKQPSPVCINGLSTVVMPIGGQVTVWAKDFNASSFDDCTPAADLLYSFSGDSYQPSFTYTCDNVPAFGVELTTQIWVADGGTDDNCNGQISWGERNKDYCTTTIVITDNNGVCDDTTGSILAGEILTEDVQSVELVAVNMTAPGKVFPTYVTATNGQFHFSNVIVPNNYEITAERNDQHRNGVSTLDLVKIQKHLLGIESLASPYDLIAADANNSHNVSAIDLVELRKLILGIYTELPSNKSWRFVDESFVFADATQPWPFDEVIDFSNMGDNSDFVAVKVGDVNNTVQANAQQILPRNGNGIVHLIAQDRAVSAGEIVDVVIRSGDFAAIEGYQFTMMTTGLEFRGVESGLVEMGEENFGVFGDMLTTSWHKIGGVSATSADALFTLRFQATTSGQLSNMIVLNSKETAAEAYNVAEEIKDVKLSFRGLETAEFALYQNEPNPFKGNTVIGYDMPEAGNVTLTVFDVTGKVLVVKDQIAVKGYNTIAVSSKELPAVGVLYYRLDANEYTATKKMIIIE